MAVYYWHLEVVQYLTEHGADVNKAGNDGCVPLHIAAQKGHLEVVQYLTEHGADVNKENNEGNISLFFTVINGKEDVVRYLASLPATSLNNCFKALQLAWLTNQNDMAQILENIIKVRIYCQITQNYIVPIWGNIRQNWFYSENHQIVWWFRKAYSYAWENSSDINQKAIWPI